MTITESPTRLRLFFCAFPLFKFYYYYCFSLFFFFCDESDGNAIASFALTVIFELCISMCCRYTRAVCIVHMDGFKIFPNNNNVIFARDSCGSI